MFWKMIGLTVMVWVVALYFSVSLGGLIHLLPVAAVVLAVMKWMSKSPDTEFGRWKSAAQRGKRQ
jgi:hypothetical protein